MTEAPQRFRMSAPFGVIAVSMQGDTLCGVELCAADEVTHSHSLSRGHPVYASLQGYFRDPARAPEVAMRIRGTAFQKRVWQALRAIPPGETRTYGELARKLNTSARAVGNACRANPLPLLIPCHRVVAVNGLGGFAGDRDGRLVGIKRWLLDHERGIKHA